MFFWSTVLLLIFGAMTLYFHNRLFLFWKPTVFYWALALACMASHWVGDKPIVQRFFGMVAELNTEKLTARQWSRLNMAWTAFFASVGVLNLYVAFNFSIEFWGTFKALGLFGLSLVFIVSQSIWIVSKLGDDALATSKDEPS